MKPDMINRVVLLFFIAVFPGACSSVDKSYTSENIYREEVKEFPFIKLASHALPEEIAEFKNLTYVSYGKRDMQLDLYAPATTMNELRPGIVLVHGGDWQGGSREQLAPLAQQFALRGYVVATISYRLAPEAKYPAAIHDTKAALRWMRANAQQYGVDAAHLAVGGTGAGGQIASLVGMTNGVEIFDPQASGSEISSNAQVVVNIDGLSAFSPQDLHHLKDKSKSSPIAFWLGGGYATHGELWHQASPINHVRKGSPAVLLMFGSQAHFSAGNDEMLMRLEHFRVPHRLERMPDTPRHFWLFEPWVSPAANIIADFLDLQFKYRMTCH